MIDRKTILDPKASPARPGVRRVNNVPVAILGFAVAVFLAIMAYVAAGRAAKPDDAKEHAPVRSALMLAKDITGDYEAGVVPAPRDVDSRLVDAARAASSSGPADALRFDPKGLPDGFPPPPQPPRLGAGTSDSVLLPPSSASLGSDAPQSAPTDHYARGSGTIEDTADIERMKLEMFKQAVRAKTSALEDTKQSAAADGLRAAPGRPDLEALRANAGASYVDKLRQLQAVGILPDGDADASKRQGDDDAYARFAGDKKQDRWSLGSKLEAPETPYELRAGAVIPATLQTGINSDLPGQITAIVAQDVRDTATGKYVLIPQASRLVGTYGSDVKFGQSRVLVAWQRIVWPDGKALDIGAMPGSDGAGYAGFADQVDNHFDRLFGGALLLSAITAGVSMSQDHFSEQNGRLTVGGAMAQSLGQELGQVSEELIRKQMNVAPTIKIRPGYRFNVQVTKDVTFNGPYHAFDYQRSIAAGSRTFRAREP